VIAPATDDRIRGWGEERWQSGTCGDRAARQLRMHTGKNLHIGLN
jgi:hypothetical protein